MVGRCPTTSTNLIRSMALPALQTTPNHRRNSGYATSQNSTITSLTAQVRLLQRDLEQIVAQLMEEILDQVTEG